MAGSPAARGASEEEAGGGGVPGAGILAGIVAGAGDAIAAVDAAGHVTVWNAAAEDLYGLRAADVLGRDVLTLGPDQRTEEASARLARALRGASERFERQLTRPDGTHVDASMTVTPLHDGDGRVIGACVISHDITERRTAQRELEVLLARAEAERNIAVALAEALDVADALPDALRAIASTLGWDAAIFWEPAGAGGALREYASAATAPGEPPRRDAGLAREVAATRAPRLHAAPDGGVPRFAFPVVARGELVGVVELRADRSGVRAAPEPSATAPLAALVAGFAEREREERRRAAEARRTAVLARAGELLATALDADATVDAIARLLVPDICDVCQVHVVSADGGLRRVAALHADPALQEALDEITTRFGGTFRAGPGRDVLERGEPVLVEELDPSAYAGFAHDDEHEGLLRRLGNRSLIAVPLRHAGAVTGRLVVAMGPSARRFSRDDVAFMLELADRSAQVLATADAFRSERAARERFRVTLEHAPIGIALVAVEAGGLRIVEANAALAAITGWAAHDLAGAYLADVAHPDSDDLEALAVALADDACQAQRLEQRWLQPDDEPRWVQVEAAPVPGADRPRQAVVQVLDVTERRRFEEQLVRLADRDALTGLFNRRRLEEEIARTVAHVRRSGEAAVLAVIDLDNFKYVNDRYGHAVGDQVLVGVANALRERTRATDVLARLGGDEFAVLLADSTLDSARRAAGALLAAIRRAVAVDEAGTAIHLTGSVGLASIAPDDGRTTGELLAEADMAMYDAKETGRDRVSVAGVGSAQPDRVRARLAWSDRIRDALERDAFELWEQPIVDLATGVVVSSEVLLRMRGDDGAIVPPAVFLPVAEHFGHIGAIDRWVVAHAVRLLAARQAAGHTTGLEVNLSGASITDPAVVASILAEIESAPIDPSALTFEVTETAAIVNVERARLLADELASVGCSFALDDFGSGFGSFYYLKHLPFDAVKIDGDFVKDLPRSRTDQLTVRAIVQIARGLGKITIAEFVQDDATIQLLRDAGVDHGQGYHLGRPRPAAIAPPVAGNP